MTSWRQVVFSVEKELLKHKISKLCDKKNLTLVVIWDKLFLNSSWTNFIKLAKGSLNKILFKTRWRKDNLCEILYMYIPFPFHRWLFIHQTTFFKTITPLYFSSSPLQNSDKCGAILNNNSMQKFIWIDGDLFSLLVHKNLWHDVL